MRLANYLNQDSPTIFTDEPNKIVAATLARYGGKFLMGGGNINVLE